MSDRPRWLAGLRRSQTETSVLDRYVDDRDVTGAVWTPAAFAPSDYARAAIRLAEAGARPDEGLLWDFAVTDVRYAADALRGVHGQADGMDGYAVLWLDPAWSADPGRAASRARDAVADVGRGNVAVGLAWGPGRGAVVAAIVAAGVAVAVSGAPDARELAGAREEGMRRLRKDDEEAEEVPVFLLGPADGAGEHVRAVDLVSEIELLAPGRGVTVRLPSSPEDERAAAQSALGALVEAARGAEGTDELAPEWFADGVDARRASLDRLDVPERIWARDYDVWAEDPTEISDRLGWLDVAFAMRDRVDDLLEFARAARAGGVSRIVLLGMGGSSLAPEMFAATLAGGVKLTVLDTTDPDFIARETASIDLEHTLFVVASKSGTTVETLSHLEHFWSLRAQGRSFVAVTDPGTPLAALARERGFLRVFENPPDIGGRYSALSYFGLVPAALCGIDVPALLDRALAMTSGCAPCVPASSSPGFRLGAAAGDAAKDGRDKLTLVLPARIASFGSWVEQLVAESTGKGGTGVVPIAGEDVGPPEVYGEDRLFVCYAMGTEPFPPGLEALEAGHPVVRMRIHDPMDVGAELFRWELATAVLGHVLGINPFDQPDVEAAKRHAREALDGEAGAEADRGSARELLEGLEPPSYLALQAFIAPTPENAARLHAVRIRLRDRYRVATMMGFGPRFLHSTGQLHKGGPDTGVFLQVTGTHATDVPVPGKPYTFGRLIDAQADGDLRALRDVRRRAARVTLDELEALA